MKKLLLTLGLIGATLTNALADGTINPLPSVITRLRIDSNGDGIGDSDATPADRLELHIFYGPADITDRNELIHYPQFAVITTVSRLGLWTGLPTVLALPGTEANGRISLQFRVCSPAGLFAETPIKEITLGSESGPGPVVWQPSSGTSPDRFYQLVGPMVNSGEVCVPEPSTLALGALAGALLLFRVRKSTKLN